MSSENQNILPQGGRATLIIGGILLALVLYLVATKSKDCGYQEGREEALTQTTTPDWEKAQQASREQLEALAKQSRSDLVAIERRMDELGTTLTSVAQASGRTKVIVVRDSPSDSSTENPDAPELPTAPDGTPLDIHGYTKNIQHRILRSEHGVRVADIDFNAASPRPWSHKLHPLRYQITTFLGEGEDEEDLSVHHELRITNPDEPGTIEQVEITSGEVRTTRGQDELMFWDPGLQLDLGLDLEGGYGGLTFYPSSYGTRRQSALRFVGLGLGYSADERINLSLTPIAGNTGRLLPLIDNLWVGPRVSYYPEGNEFSFGFFLGVEL